MVIGLLGTDFCSPNRGCGALGYAAIEILKRMCVKKEEILEVYAFLFQEEPEPQNIDKNVVMHYIKMEIKKPSFWKNSMKIFNKCDMVWDFTGGDSFSDIYGMKRFCINSVLKEMAIISKAKFFMAPQTIGPFEKQFALSWAKHILRKADGCFVRDSLSQKYVQETFRLAPILTTDVAFALPCGDRLQEDENRIKVGFNPSGLLWDGTREFSVRKHITLDYRKYVRTVLTELCNKKYQVYLIPHVFTQNLNSTENDLKACIEIQKEFPNVKLLCDFDTPMEAKGLISSMDVFIGARMHATIAAFSTGVATIPFSYSRKFEGLYQDLEYPYLISATYMETEEAISSTLEWIGNYQMLKKDVDAAQTIIKEKQDVLINALCKMTES